MRISKSFLGIALAAAIATSCSTPKDITYFQNIDKNFPKELATPLDIKVKPDDRLSIVVTSKDPQLASLFNLPTYNVHLGTGVGGGDDSSFAAGTGGDRVSSYVVDRFGDIIFPVLGPIHVGGMRRQEVAEFIRDEIIKKDYIKDPTVIVEFLNNHVVVLGEVASPGYVGFNTDRFTIIEALGKAGDLNLEGRRDNVLVIRQIDGKPQAFRVDLTDAQGLYASPVYYMQQNDYVYVEPNATRKRSTTANGNSPFTPAFWFSIISMMLTLGVLIVK